MNLRDQYNKWKEWSLTADTSEDGWQSRYPAWAVLMQTAMSAMSQPRLSVEQLEDIEQCWLISEETEDMASFAKDHISQTWKSLCRLSESKYPEVRWQVYDALSSAGSKSEPLLRRGIEDSDPYARRRAILSLARLNPIDAEQLTKRFIDDDDPYIRQAALAIAYSSKDVNIIDWARNKLAHDSVDHVRRAAQQGLPRAGD
jgi:hypothetical protein